jgi:hypothetical protein
MILTTLLSILSLFIGILALIGTSPFWLKLVVRYIYPSKMSIELSKMHPEFETVEPGETIDYSNVSNLRLGITNGRKKRLKYGIAIYSYHRMNLDRSLSDMFGDMDTEDKTPFSAVNKPKNTRYQILARNGYVEELSSGSYDLPLSTPEESYGPESRTKFGIAIIPEISLNTLSLGHYSLPDFFGNAKLKPVVNEYSIERKKDRNMKHTEW